MFKHFLITRFNINYKGTPDSIVLSDAWLGYRMGIFLRFTFSSIINQSNKNFTWLICLDGNTPQKYKEMMQRAAQKYSFIKPIYIAESSGYLSTLDKEIKQTVDPGTDFVITTRIDNDDALHKDAMDVIQKHFTKQPNHIINLNNGLLLRVSDEGYKMASMYYISNPFISLIEKVSPTESLKTIMSKDHTHWRNDMSTMIPVNHKYLWLQIIHGENWMNQFTGNPYRNVKILEEFGIDYSGITYSFSTFIKDFIVFNWKRVKRKLLFK